MPHLWDTIDENMTRRLFREGQTGQRMVAVVSHHPDHKGKKYRLPSNHDLHIYREAEAALESKRRALWAESGIDPVPEESIPLMSGTFNVPLYGITRWGELFNARQRLALITFVEKLRCARKLLFSQSVEVVSRNLLKSE